MPIFLERIILPALVAILAALGITNPLALSWQVRAVMSVTVLAVGFGISLWLHRYNQGKASASPMVRGAYPITLPDGRFLVRESPEHLMRKTDNLMRVEADRVTAPYVGKWIMVIGTVRNVVRHRDHMNLILGVSNGAWQSHARLCVMSFESAAWGDQLNLLTKGGCVRTLGKIKEISSDTLYLSDCEVVADE